MTIQHRLHNCPWYQLVLPLVFFAAGSSIIHFYGCFEFDPDEGINLMKAWLLNNDFQLYQEIWNDQPPLLTHLLAATFSVVEPSVNLARGLVLLFATALLWQTWLVLYLLGGVLHAYIGSLFLAIAPNYWKLSVSVMVGLPCITLAMTAVLSIILWHSTGKNLWLITSALFLSLSVLTKLFSLFLAPVIVTGIFVDRLVSIKISWRSRIKAPLLWIAVFVGCSLLILLSLVGIENIHLLVDNHTSARSIATFQDLALSRSLRNDYRLFLIGFTAWGTIIACRRQQWQVLYFSAWSIIAYFLLVNHRPVWYHQVLLLHIPAIVMVGYAMGEIITTIMRRGSSYLRFYWRIILALFTIAVFYAAILLIGEQTKTTTKEIKSWQTACNSTVQSTSFDRQFLNEITQFKSKTDWIVTDSPIFAFRAGIPVPPATAVLSRKQLETGNITEAELIDIIERYQPEQVFFKRFDWSGVSSYLDRDYQLAKQTKNFRLYKRD